MRTQKSSLRSAVAALALLASLACENRAHAQITYGNDLNLGGGYNSTPNFYSFDNTVSGSGGPIGPSTLNGYALPWVYCIDIRDTIPVATNYTNTGVSSDGTALYNNTPGPLGTGTFPGPITLTNANIIAGLLNTYGASAQAGGVTDQDALQAAIWAAVYGYDNSKGSGFYVTDSATYNQMLTYLGLAQGTTTVVLTSAPTANPNTAVWMSPGIIGDSTIYQALVTTVPEPSTFAIAGLGALGFLGYGWKRRKRS